jgi:hypothetical protein
MDSHSPLPRGGPRRHEIGMVGREWRHPAGDFCGSTANQGNVQMRVAPVVRQRTAPTWLSDPGEADEFDTRLGQGREIGGGNCGFMEIRQMELFHGGWLAGFRIYLTKSTVASLALMITSVMKSIRGANWKLAELDSCSNTGFQIGSAEL